MQLLANCRAVLARLGITRREARLLALLALAGFALRVAFVLTTQDHTLRGDEHEYDLEGRFIEEGKWFWTTTPTGVPHEGMWKTPVYPAFVGVMYKLLGTDYDRVFLVQAAIGMVTIALTWLLARKLFGARVAWAAAAVVALLPFAWQFEVRLYAESLVTPLTLLLLLLVLDEAPTWRRVIGVGALCGLIILTRPSALYLVPMIAVAFLVTAGVRRGLVLSAAATVTAALVILPWTIRNHEVSGAWVPLSTQSAAPYGVFNDDSANDEEYPWAWRIFNERDRPILENARELGEVEFADRLRENTVEYIKDNPSSVPKAFFWNGITRLWDVRRPRHVLDEAESTGRPRWFAGIALGAYWIALPLALAGLVLLRRRPALLLPLLAMAASASVIYTADGLTRYRAPFDPVIAILACFAVLTLLERRRAPAA